jgi:hypothetical protein
VRLNFYSIKIFVETIKCIMKQYYIDDDVDMANPYNINSEADDTDVELDEEED